MASMANLPPLEGTASQWHLVQQTRDQAFTAGNRTLVETVTNWKDRLRVIIACPLCARYYIGHYGGKGRGRTQTSPSPSAYFRYLASSLGRPSLPPFHKYASVPTLG